MAPHLALKVQARVHPADPGRVADDPLSSAADRGVMLPCSEDEVARRAKSITLKALCRRLPTPSRSPPGRGAGAGGEALSQRPIRCTNVFAGVATKFPAQAKDARTTAGTWPSLPEQDENPACIASSAVPGRGLSFDADVGGMPVSLQIYNVSREGAIWWLNTALANEALPIKFGGAFHVGVEVGGLEWSYGFSSRESQSGVACKLPKCDQRHVFRQTLHLGVTRLSADQVSAILRDLIDEYPGCNYDLLQLNCCHFAEDFAHRLGVGPIPGWLCRLARVGARAEEILQSLVQSLPTCARKRRIPLEIGELDIRALEAALGNVEAFSDGLDARLP